MNMKIFLHERNNSWAILLFCSSRAIPGSPGLYTALWKKNAMYKCSAFVAHCFRHSSSPGFIYYVVKKMSKNSIITFILKLKFLYSASEGDIVKRPSNHCLLCYWNHKKWWNKRGIYLYMFNLAVSCWFIPIFSIMIEYQPINKLEVIILHSISVICFRTSFLPYTATYFPAGHAYTTLLYSLPLKSMAYLLSLIWIYIVKICFYLPCQPSFHAFF